MEETLLIEAPKQEIVIPEKRSVGRPTKYENEITLLKVDEYVEQCQDEEYDYQTLSGKSDGYQYRVRVKLPTKEGLARFLGVNGDTLVEWAKNYAKFSAALTRVMDLQKERLMMGGLSNSYNPIITKFLLSANHGMSENTRVENTVILPSPIMEIPSEDVSENNGN